MHAEGRGKRAKSSDFRAVSQSAGRRTRSRSALRGPERLWKTVCSLGIQLPRGVETTQSTLSGAKPGGWNEVT